MNKQSLLKSRRLQLSLVGVIVFIIATSMAIAPIKQRITRYRLNNCLQHKEYPRCLKIIESTASDKPLTPELSGHLQTALSAYTQTLPNSDAIKFTQQLLTKLPQEKLIKKHLIELELVQIKSTTSDSNDLLVEQSLKFSETYANDAAVQFNLANILWEKSPTLLAPIITVLTRAIKLEKKYAEEAISQEIVTKALAEIPRSYSDTTCALVENYFLEGMLPMLQENLKSRENSILRNNAYQILKSANQVTEDDIFLHHWLNLLSGSSETQDDYKQALEYFETLDQGAAVIDKSNLSQKLDFTYFPNIDKIPDYYLHETLKLLMKVFPTETQQMLVNNLKNKTNHWRRVNSFYTLQDNDGLDKSFIANYHSINLALKEYDYFTDWLSDSIDYYAKLKAFEKLKTFATRIRALKQSRNTSKEQDQVTVYTQIENYVRSKIGRN